MHKPRLRTAVTGRTLQATAWHALAHTSRHTAAAGTFCRQYTGPAGLLTRFAVQIPGRINIIYPFRTPAGGSSGKARPAEARSRKMPLECCWNKLVSLLELPNMYTTVHVLTREGRPPAWHLAHPPRVAVVARSEQVPPTQRLVSGVPRSAGCSGLDCTQACGTKFAGQHTPTQAVVLMTSLFLLHAHTVLTN